MKEKTLDEKREIVFKHYSKAYGVTLPKDLSPLTISELYQKLQMLIDEEQDFKENRPLTLF